ncbi:GTPase [Aquisphaera insulae]|uniref:GTPase n=1 Tax=Aquisphaera insulae TaxID=2712864 RepID=UPI0013ED0A2C|nr:GTPase [Aquisphaera insulae]
MLGLLKQWRLWVLAFLLVGPVVVYVGFGTIWLWQAGWLWLAALVWIAAGVAFSVLAARWTKNVHAIMPPLDWDSPETFSPRDRDAWGLVEEEARAGDELSMEELTNADLYMETGRRLLTRLAGFYHPSSDNPLSQVPLIELLTAIELASEDLAHLSRQVPGADVITLAHWQRAVQISNYISKANDIYSMFSPLLNPLSGLARLGTREMLVKPAWRDMQLNVLRWFYQAYVNRIGVHLVELMSGRLAIGADRYRRLTRRSGGRRREEPAADAPLVVAVVGVQGVGKSRLIEALKQATAGDAGLIRAWFEGQGLDPSLIDRLRQLRWVEAPGYSGTVDREGRRDRRSRKEATEAAIHADLVILVLDQSRGLQPADVAVAQAWDHHFMEHPQQEAPPTLVVVTGVDRAEIGAPWAPPYDWENGKGVREAAVRSVFDAVRSTLPPAFGAFAAAGLGDDKAFGVLESVLPALAAQLHRAERTSLVRQLHSLSGRSALGRVMSQLGDHGRHAWANIKERRKSSRSGAS